MDLTMIRPYKVDELVGKLNIYDFWTSCNRKCCESTKVISISENVSDREVLSAYSGKVFIEALYLKSLVDILYEEEQVCKQDYAQYSDMICDLIRIIDGYRAFVLDMDSFITADKRQYKKLILNDGVWYLLLMDMFYQTIKLHFESSDDTEMIITRMKQLILDAYPGIGLGIPIIPLINEKIDKLVFDENEERANPYHDEKGRFCSGGNAVFISEWASNVNEENGDPPPSLLTQSEKEYYKSKLRCSDELISFIRNKYEAEIYVKAKLHEETINGRKCLVRDDIPLTEKNLADMSKGNVPSDDSGKQIILHHIGQKNYSPLAELTYNEHSEDGNFSYLHDVRISKSSIDRRGFDTIRKNHWKSRANQIKEVK